MRLAERAHLQPVAEQHDHDEQRELPPEVEIEAADVELVARLAANATVIARAISSIMPGWRARSSATSTAQKRPTAVEEDDGAEHR